MILLNYFGIYKKILLVINLDNFERWSINESLPFGYKWASAPKNITAAQKKSFEDKLINLGIAAFDKSEDINFPYSSRYWEALKIRLGENKITFKYGDTSAIPKQWIYWGEKVIYSDKRPLLSRNNSAKDEVLAYLPLAYNGVVLDKFWVIGMWTNSSGISILKEITLLDFLSKSTTDLISNYFGGISKEAIKAVDTFISSVESTQQAEEVARGSNKGPKVNPLLTKVGASPGDPWCAAFIYGILTNTTFSSSIKSKIPNSASVKYHWEKSKGFKIYPNSVKSNPDLVKPGMAFFFLTNVSKGKGHTGIILSKKKGESGWSGVEGNTNPLDGSREGYGSFILYRKMDNPSTAKDRNSNPAKPLGYIDYFRIYRNPEFDSYMAKKCNELLNRLNPKTTKEIAYIKANPKVLDTYEKNYKNRYNS